LQSTGKGGSQTPLPEETAKQVGEVLTLVKELKDARALQTQQTSDIARCKSIAVLVVASIDPIQI
jgi:hypothetical protein